MPPCSRRALLGALAAGAASVAGCAGSDSATTRTTTETTSATSTTTTATTTESTTEPPGGECDSRWEPGVEWSIPTETRAYEPAVADGTVYFGSQDRHLYAVDAATGEREWRVEHRGMLDRRPVVRDGVVTYAGYDRITAFDADGGSELWSFAPPGDIADVSRTEGTADGVVYVGASQHPGPNQAVETEYNRVHAFDRRTGEERWQREVVSGDGDWTPKYVAADGDRVFVAAQNGTLLALDAADGSEVWRHSTGDGHRPVVAGDAVYLSVHPRLVALDAASGEVRWQARSTVPPSIADGVVYAPDGDELRALDADGGEPLWTAELPDDSRALTPARIGDAVYLPADGDDHGRLYAFDAASGCRHGFFEVRSVRPTTPDGADGLVFVGGLNGEGRMWAVSGVGE